MYCDSQDLKKLSRSSYSSYHSGNLVFYVNLNPFIGDKICTVATPLSLTGKDHVNSCDKYLTI